MDDTDADGEWSDEDMDKLGMLTGKSEDNQDSSKYQSYVITLRRPTSNSQHITAAKPRLSNLTLDILTGTSSDHSVQSKDDPVSVVMDKIDAELEAMNSKFNGVSAGVNVTQKSPTNSQRTAPSKQKLPAVFQRHQTGGHESSNLRTPEASNTNKKETTSGSATTTSDALTTEGGGLGEEAELDMLEDLEQISAEQIDRKFKEILWKKKGIRSWSSDRPSTTLLSAGYSTDNDSVRTEDFEAKFLGMMVQPSDLEASLGKIDSVTNPGSRAGKNDRHERSKRESTTSRLRYKDETFQRATATAESTSPGFKSRPKSIINRPRSLSLNSRSTYIMNSFQSNQKADNSRDTVDAVGHSPQRRSNQLFSWDDVFWKQNFKKGPQSIASTTSTFEEVESLCLSKSSSDSMGSSQRHWDRISGTSSSKWSGTPPSRKFLSRQSSAASTSTSRSSGLSGESAHVEQPWNSNAMRGESFTDMLMEGLDYLSAQGKLDVSDKFYLEKLFQRVLDWNKGNPLSSGTSSDAGKDFQRNMQSKQSSVTHRDGRTLSLSQHSEQNEKLDRAGKPITPSKLFSEASPEAVNPVSTTKRLRDLILPDEDSAGSGSNGNSRQSSKSERRGDSSSRATTASSKELSTDSALRHLNVPSSAADDTSRLSRQASVVSQQAYHYNLSASSFRQTGSFESTASPPDPYMFSQPYTTSHAERVLMGLGFGATEGFLPERFLRDWYNKIAKAQMEAQIAEAKDKDSFDSLSGMFHVPGSIKAVPENHNIDVTQCTVYDPSHSHSPRPLFEEHQSLLPPGNDKDTKLERLSEYIRTYFNNVSAITQDRNIKVKQFATSRQKSLPLCLETLSEEEESRSRISALNPYDKDARLKMFLSDAIPRSRRSSNSTPSQVSSIQSESDSNSTSSDRRGSRRHAKGNHQSPHKTRDSKKERETGNPEMSNQDVASSVSRCGINEKATPTGGSNSQLNNTDSRSSYGKQLQYTAMESPKPGLRLQKSPIRQPAIDTGVSMPCEATVTPSPNRSLNGQLNSSKVHDLEKRDVVLFKSLKDIKKTTSIHSIDSLEVADIMHSSQVTKGQQFSVRNQGHAENDIGQGRGRNPALKNVEPAMVSIVLEDVDQYDGDSSADYPSPSQEGLHLSIPTSRRSSYSLSPIPQSPVTVIEVSLDNQQDSLDTEGTTSSKETDEDNTGMNSSSASSGKDGAKTYRRDRKGSPSHKPGRLRRTRSGDGLSSIPCQLSFIQTSADSSDGRSQRRLSLEVPLISELPHILQKQQVLKVSRSLEAYIEEHKNGAKREATASEDDKFNMKRESSKDKSNLAISGRKSSSPIHYPKKNESQRHSRDNSDEMGVSFGENTENKCPVFLENSSSCATCSCELSKPPRRCSPSSTQQGLDRQPQYLDDSSYDVKNENRGQSSNINTSSTELSKNIPRSNESSPWSAKSAFRSATKRNAQNSPLSSVVPNSQKGLEDAHERHLHNPFRVNNFVTEFPQTETCVTCVSKNFPSYIQTFSNQTPGHNISGYNHSEKGQIHRISRAVQVSEYMPQDGKLNRHEAVYDLSEYYYACDRGAQCDLTDSSLQPNGNLGAHHLDKFTQTGTPQFEISCQTNETFFVRDNSYQVSARRIHSQTKAVNTVVCLIGPEHDNPHTLGLHPEPINDGFFPQPIIEHSYTDFSIVDETLQLIEEELRRISNSEFQRFSTNRSFCSGNNLLEHSNGLPQRSAYSQDILNSQVFPFNVNDSRPRNADRGGHAPKRFAPSSWPDAVEWTSASETSRVYEMPPESKARQMYHKDILKPASATFAVTGNSNSQERLLTNIHLDQFRGKYDSKQNQHSRIPNHSVPATTFKNENNLDMKDSKHFSGNELNDVIYQDNVISGSFKRNLGQKTESGFPRSITNDNGRFEFTPETLLANKENPTPHVSSESDKQIAKSQYSPTSGIWLEQNDFEKKQSGMDNLLGCSNESGFSLPENESAGKGFSSHRGVEIETNSTITKHLSPKRPTMAFSDGKGSILNLPKSEDDNSSCSSSSNEVRVIMEDHLPAESIPSLSEVPKDEENIHTAGRPFADPELIQVGAGVEDSTGLWLNFKDVRQTSSLAATTDSDPLLFRSDKQNENESYSSIMEISGCQKPMTQEESESLNKNIPEDTKADNHTSDITTLLNMNQSNLSAFPNLSRDLSGFPSTIPEIIISPVTEFENGFLQVSTSPDHLIRKSTYPSSSESTDSSNTLSSPASHKVSDLESASAIFSVNNGSNTNWTVLDVNTGSNTNQVAFDVNNCSNTNHSVLSGSNTTQTASFVNSGSNSNKTASDANIGSTPYQTAPDVILTEPPPLRSDEIEDLKKISPSLTNVNTINSHQTSTTNPRNILFTEKTIDDTIDSSNCRNCSSFPENGCCDDANLLSSSNKYVDRSDFDVRTLHAFATHPAVFDLDMFGLNHTVLAFQTPDGAIVGARKSESVDCVSNESLPGSNYDQDIDADVDALADERTSGSSYSDPVLDMVDSSSEDSTASVEKKKKKSRSRRAFLTVENSDDDLLQVSEFGDVSPLASPAREHPRTLSTSTAVNKQTTETSSTGMKPEGGTHDVNEGSLHLEIELRAESDHNLNLTSPPSENEVIKSSRNNSLVVIESELVQKDEDVSVDVRDKEKVSGDEEQIPPAPTSQHDDQDTEHGEMLLGSHDSSERDHLKEVRIINTNSSRVRKLVKMSSDPVDKDVYCRAVQMHVLREKAANFAQEYPTLEETLSELECEISETDPRDFISNNHDADYDMLELFQKENLAASHTVSILGLAETTGQDTENITFVYSDTARVIDVEITSNSTDDDTQTTPNCEKTFSDEAKNLTEEMKMVAWFGTTYNHYDSTANHVWESSSEASSSVYRLSQISEETQGAYNTSEESEEILWEVRNRFTASQDSADNTVSRSSELNRNKNIFNPTPETTISETGTSYITRKEEPHCNDIKESKAFVLKNISNNVESLPDSCGQHVSNLELVLPLDDENDPSLPIQSSVAITDKDVIENNLTNSTLRSSSVQQKSLYTSADRADTRKNLSRVSLQKNSSQITPYETHVVERTIDSFGRITTTTTLTQTVRKTHYESGVLGPRDASAKEDSLNINKHISTAVLSVGDYRKHPGRGDPDTELTSITLPLSGPQDGLNPAILNSLKHSEEVGQSYLKTKLETNWLLANDQMRSSVSDGHEPSDFINGSEDISNVNISNGNDFDNGISNETINAIINTERSSISRTARSDTSRQVDNVHADASNGDTENNVLSVYSSRINSVSGSPVSIAAGRYINTDLSIHNYGFTSAQMARDTVNNAENAAAGSLLLQKALKDKLFSVFCSGPLEPHFPNAQKGGSDSHTSTSLRDSQYSEVSSGVTSQNTTTLPNKEVKDQVRTMFLLDRPDEKPQPDESLSSFDSDNEDLDKAKPQRATKESSLDKADVVTFAEDHLGTNLLTRNPGNSQTRKNNDLHSTENLETFTGFSSMEDLSSEESSKEPSLEIMTNERTTSSSAFFTSCPEKDESHDLENIADAPLSLSTPASLGFDKFRENGLVQQLKSREICNDLHTRTPSFDRKETSQKGDRTESPDTKPRLLRSRESLLRLHHSSLNSNDSYSDVISALKTQGDYDIRKLDQELGRLSYEEEDELAFFERNIPSSQELPPCHTILSASPLRESTTQNGLAESMFANDSSGLIQNLGSSKPRSMPSRKDNFEVTQAPYVVIQQPSLDNSQPNEVSLVTTGPCVEPIPSMSEGNEQKLSLTSSDSKNRTTLSGGSSSSWPPRNPRTRFLSPSAAKAQQPPVMLAPHPEQYIRHHNHAHPELSYLDIIPSLSRQQQNVNVEVTNQHQIEFIVTRPDTVTSETHLSDTNINHDANIAANADAMGLPFRSPESAHDGSYDPKQGSFVSTGESDTTVLMSSKSPHFNTAIPSSLNLCVTKTGNRTFPPDVISDSREIFNPSSEVPPEDGSVQYEYGYTDTTTSYKKSLSVTSRDSGFDSHGSPIDLFHKVMDPVTPQYSAIREESVPSVQDLSTDN